MTVQVKGDTLVEADETFRLHLSNPSGAMIGKENGVGTILNDDRPVEPPGRLSFSDGGYTVLENAGFRTVTVVRAAGRPGR